MVSVCTAFTVYALLSQLRGCILVVTRSILACNSHSTAHGLTVVPARGVPIIFARRALECNRRLQKLIQHRLQDRTFRDHNPMCFTGCPRPFSRAPLCFTVRDLQNSLPTVGALRNGDSYTLLFVTCPTFWLQKGGVPFILVWKNTKLEGGRRAPGHPGEPGEPRRRPQPNLHCKGGPGGQEPPRYQ